MMQPFNQHTGTAVAIPLANIDTDQIIPKQFLTRIERSGYGRYLFFDWRYTPSGEPIESFALNQPDAKAATILIAGENFGCGSSREHAAWSLLDHGFRVVIAPSFADIFYSNSLKNGLLPIALDQSAVDRLSDRAADGIAISVDLVAQQVICDGFSAPFEIDPFRKNCLLNGLDDIGLTLTRTGEISAFELLYDEQFPYLKLAAS